MTALIISTIDIIAKIILIIIIIIKFKVIIKRIKTKKFNMVNISVEIEDKNFLSGKLSW